MFYPLIEDWSKTAVSTQADQILHNPQSHNPNGKRVAKGWVQIQVCKYMKEQKLDTSDVRSYLLLLTSYKNRS